MTRMLACCAVLVAACCPPAPVKKVVAAKVAPPEVKDLATPEELHLKHLHQLTFGGDNAEAYWSFAGDRLIMQTNHKPYACDQIEEMPITGIGAGNGKLVSTGKGRTTCSYFLKGDQEIIYASTHESSPACPTPPDMSKGYYWGLFEYDIYRANADGTNLRKLTDTPGYDAEATVCPVDGSILFTSMRSGDLELWRMDADGKNLKQLTSTPGYDGGAFYSADCKQIVWRASRPQGEELAQYESLLKQKLVKPTHMDLWVANADGTEAHQVTYLPGASFGPYFFPSGKRIIFASNYLAPRGPEFDLFAINTDGTDLERITYAGGFDGFPMFSPDGKYLSFSSNRRDVVQQQGKDVYRMTGGPAGEHDTNVFLAEWADAVSAKYQPETDAANRYRDAVRYLADDAREGRGIGTKGLVDAEDFVEKQLATAGVEPGLGGAWRQPFEVTTKVERGGKTALALDGKAVVTDDFAPIAASGSGAATGAIVPVGWGIVDADAKLDDYKGKSVKGKIALVHRFAPTDAKLSGADISRLGDLRYKAFIARGKGATALLVVDDGDPKQEEAPLPALAAAESEAGIPVIVMTRKAWGKGARAAKLAVELVPVRAKTDNVVGVIRAGAAQKQPGVIVIGAHVDHLGMGGGANALDPKVNAVHNGADDNASGVAGLLEVARTLSAKRSELARDVYIVAFSGEEEGDLGSDYYTKHLPVAQKVVAMLNMDMIGRMRSDKLSVSGGASAKQWTELVAPACKAAQVDCAIGGSGYGPSDHMAFYVTGVPVLFFFTGNHLDYHTATDDSDKINSAGGARVAMIAADVALATAKLPALDYVKAPPENVFGGDVRRKGASLGTVPSYDEDPSRPPGVLLSDVVPDGAAAKAGLVGGDRIIQIGATEIRNVEDLMFVLETSKPGTEAKITFVRAGKTQTATATFGVPRGRR